MFDPEKVERFYNVEFDGIHQGDMVLSEDYDQLLGLYRGLLRQWNQGLRDSQHAADIGITDYLGQRSKGMGSGRH